MWEDEAIQQDLQPNMANDKTSSLKQTKANPKLAKFKKMLSMGIPPPAVRQKMIMAEISQADINAFFGNDNNNNNNRNRNGNGNGNSNKSPAQQKAMNPKLLKFKKMLSMGIPPPAVRQKMIMAEISQTEINAFFGESSSNTNKDGTKVSKPKPMNPKLLKFKKMLSMGIPAPAVRQKMMMAQISAADISDFFDSDGNGTISNASSITTTPKPKSNLMKLHWDKMEEVPEDSVWANVNGSTADTNKDDNIARLKQLFAKTSNTKKGNGKGHGRNSGEKKRRRSSIDGKRTQNIEIGLAQYKQFPTFDDVVAAVCEMNREKLTTAKVSTLVDICPTPLETKAVLNTLKLNKKKWNASPPDGTEVMKKNNMPKLSKAEQWVLACNKTSKFPVKCKTFLYVLQFNDNFKQISNRIATISNACRSITDSKSLKSVLGNVLAIGNAMNQGTHAGGARGFKLDSLLKLTQTKSQDKKTTVLDFLVESEAEEAKNGNNINLAGSWVKELKDLSNAARLRRNEIVKEFNRLKSGMEAVERISNANHIEEDDVGDFLEMAFSSACNEFVSKDSRKIQMLHTQLDDMGRLCVTVAQYFGEDPKTYDVSKAFNTLGVFSKTYESSLKKYTERVERMKRMERRRSSGSFSGRQSNNGRR